MPAGSVTQQLYQAYHPPKTHTHIMVLEHPVQILIVRVLSVIPASTSIAPEFHSNENTMGGKHAIDPNQSEPR